MMSICQSPAPTAQSTAMYAMPFYPPWFGTPQSNNDMGPKEWFEFIKTYEEWKTAQKPKEDKKPASPDAWTTADYLTLNLFIGAVSIPVITCVILSYITTLIKAVH